MPGFFVCGAPRASDAAARRAAMATYLTSRGWVVDDRLKREGKDSPNTKYRSRSALLQERASKLVSGSGELTTRVEPAMNGCEA
jgi:hypothetical protein